ncbi:MAG: hypothetical protein ABJH05_08240 [Fulvivirga sp.]
MKTKSLLMALGLLLVFSGAFAQKLKVKGDMKFMKEVKTLDLEFTYDNMSVGKYDKEDEYLSERVAKRNEDEPGKGDEWREAWVNDREERFEPQFEELVNKYLSDEGIKAERGLSDAEYKAVIHTVHTEPGFNVGVVRRPAHINVEVMFINKASGETMATMTVDKVPGRDAMGYDFDTGYRIQEAYAKLGKEIGKYIVKKVL